MHKLCRSLKRKDAVLSSARGKAFLSVKLPVIILEKETEKESDKEGEKEQEVESPQQRPRKSFGGLTSTGKWYRINSLLTKERLAYLYASAKKKRVEEPKDLDQRKKDNAAVLLYFNENQGKIECVVSKKTFNYGENHFSESLANMICHSTLSLQLAFWRASMRKIYPSALASQKLKNVP